MCGHEREEVGRVPVVGVQTALLSLTISFRVFGVLCLKVPVSINLMDQQTPLLIFSIFVLRIREK